MTQPADDKLHDSAVRMRLLIDSIPDYAIYMLDPTGHVASWNAGAQRIKGYQADEIVGRHFSVFYPKDSAPARWEEELRIATETGRFEEEAWRVRKDGSRFWANVVLTAVRDDVGNLVGFAKVTRDLTERRKAEQQRAELVAEQRANRLKDEFLAILGHELRNPLAPIVTALELMKLRGVGVSKEYEVIERQVQHLQRLVDDLLDVSRIAQGKLSLKKVRIELAEVVARAIEMASPMLELRRHQLTVDLPRHGLPLQADPVRLAQAITNLVNNAAKYTPECGNIHIAGRREGEEVVLEIKDDGIGIAAELVPQIFDLFVQAPRATDRSAGGLGVGLTLVRSLMRLHHGTVSAFSEGVGKGSTFVVRMPAEVDALATPMAGTPQAPAVGTRRRKVLIVDDNPDAAALLGEALSIMGHEVRLAHDGPRALQVLETFTPDLAVLDLGLPVMDGYELARHVRETLGDKVHLVALTGYGQDRDREATRAAGFADHVVKPIDLAQVRRIVEASADA